MEQDRLRELQNDSQIRPIDFIWYNPHGFQKGEKNPNGVDRLAQEGIDRLRQAGYNIVTVAPKVGDNSKNVADFNIGRTFVPSGALGRFVAGQIGTSYPFSLPFNKWEAFEMFFRLKPHAIFVEEPFQGFGPHSIFSGIPTREEDNKPVPVEIARFHAGRFNKRAENVFKVLLGAGKAFRRPRFTEFGFPNGRFTKGVVSTLLDDLDISIAVSKATAEASRKRHGQGRDFRVVYNGIDTERFKPEGKKRETWKRDDKKIVLIAMGRMEKRKGYEVGILAYEQIKKIRPNTKLIIAGDGLEEKSLRELVKTRQIKDVEFAGLLTSQEYEMALRTADIGLYPAIGGEGFGRVVAEGLASGLLSVVSSIDGYNEVTDGGKPFALMAQAKNAGDFAQKAIKILDMSDETREKLKWESASYINSSFAWDIITGQLVVLFDEAFRSHEKVDWEKAQERYAKKLKKLSLTGDIFVAKR